MMQLNTAQLPRPNSYSGEQRRMLFVPVHALCGARIFLLGLVSALMTESRSTCAVPEALRSRLAHRKEAIRVYKK